ncbi:MAG: DUF4342 domain-containing protein [Euryarchaeota archaeon]|nr:DUF4342 domain-containing protein [Euryarchaeota archaeon]
MKECKKCGAELLDEANFCHMCGVATQRKREKFVIDSDGLVKKVKKILHEGNVTKIIIEDDKGKILLEIPVTVGAVGVLLAPWLAALGAIAAIAAECTIIVE